MARFRPPRDVPDLGLSPGQQARFNAWLRTAFVEIAEDMAALGRVDNGTQVAQETIDVAEGSLRRVTPPTGGMAVRVPPPSSGNAGATIRIMIESPVGPLTIVSRPGVGDDGKVFQPTINGQPRATFTASGLVVLTSSGASDWKTSAEFAAESAASARSSAAALGLGAEYHLASPNSLLPNARVADDSDEIDLDHSVPRVVTWFLKTASVAFSKLANLTGLSVLGRAADSAGVMAAITASAARQALMSNAAGTAIGWRSIEGEDLPTTSPYGWGDVLDVSASSGTNNPSIASGQHLAFAGGGLSSGDVRGASGLVLRATNGNLTAEAGSANAVISGFGVFVTASVTGFQTSSTTYFRVRTGSGPTERLEITADGEWQVGGDVGDARQTLTSGGTGTPPTWSYPVEVRDSGSDQGDVFALDFVAGTNVNLAASVAGGVATITPSVDLSSVTYTAGDGIDLAANEFSLNGAEAGEIIRFSTQEDGPNTTGTYEPTIDAETTIYRINPAAGDTITFTGFEFVGGNSGKKFLLLKQGGDGSVVVKHNAGATSTNGAFTPFEVDYVLAGANTACIVWYQTSSARWNIASVTFANGDGLDLSGNTFSVDVSDFAGAGIEDDGSNNLRIAAAAAGDGLTGGGGSALAVGAGTGITVNANDVAVNQAADFAWTGDHDFGGAVIFESVHNEGSVTADITDLDIGSANVVRFTTTGGSPPYALNSMVPIADGHTAFIVNPDSVDRFGIVQNSTAGSDANDFLLSGAPPDDTEVYLPQRSMVLARKDSISGRWYIAGLIAPFYNSSECEEKDRIIHDGTDYVRTQALRKSHDICEWWEDFSFITSTSLPGTLFMGNGNWHSNTAGSVGGSISALGGEAGHPGIVRLTTHTVDNNLISIFRGSTDTSTPVGAPWIRGTDVREFVAIVRSTVTQTKALIIGFAENILSVDISGTGQSNIMAFMFDSDAASLDNNIHCVTRDNDGTATFTDSGVSMSSIHGEWVCLRILQSTPGTVEFYIDGALVVTHSGASVPDAEVMNCGLTVITRAGSATVLDVDYVSFESHPLGRA